jgi:hypothetical protein
LCFLLLELALRIYNPIVKTANGEGVVLRVDYDEFERNTRIPGVASEIHIHQNSLGFRGADPPTNLADRLSIITVGGSITRSATQSDNYTWTALLGNAVANCFDSTWINNAGFEGHSSFAHIQLIRGYINKLHPKVVIMLIGANELDRNGPIVGPTAFDREQVMTDLNFDSGIKGFLKGLANRSDLVALGLTLYRDFVSWRIGLTYVNSDWASLPEGAPTPPDGEGKLAAIRDVQSAYAERLRVLIRLLRRNQTIPVLVTQPTVAGLARDPTTGKDLSRLQNGLLWYESLNSFNDTTRKVAQNEHVFLVDLERSMPKDTKYYWDFIHFTDTGAAKVGQLIAAAILPYLAQEFPMYSDGTCDIDAVHPG